MRYLNNIKLLAIVLGSSSLLSSWSAFSQTELSQEDDLRWFEVEVILYKATSDKGLTNESWATDTQMKLPENVIDFLQPFGVLEPADQEAADNKVTDSDEAIIDHASNDSFEMVEKPFVKLDDELLQLKDEARNISRHSSYNLLAHFAWRQPVLSKKEASELRIAGGFDHHEAFDYSGEKKLEKIPTNDPLSELNADSNIESTDKELTNNDSDNVAKQDQLNFQPVALPWVPEIDGSIRVYIHRNYLHVDTDLFYRRPGKEELDIFELPNQLSALGEQSLTGAQSIKPEVPGAQDPLKKDPLLKDTLDISPQIANDSAFAWEYDGDFLSDDTEKVFSERLFNYPLKQKRRLKSTQLNYFDHPLIGMLIIIRPYDVNAANSKALNEQNQIVSRVNNL